MRIDDDSASDRTSRARALIERWLHADSNREDLERQWFVAMAAVESIKDDYRARLRIVSRAEEASRQDSAQIAELEAVRDALGEKLASFGARESNSCFAG